MASKMVCKGLDINLNMRGLFSFFVTKPVKSSCVTMSNRWTKGLFTSHSNDYKHWKDKFVRVRGQEDSLGMLGTDGVLVSVIMDL